MVNEFSFFLLDYVYNLGTKWQMTWRFLWVLLGLKVEPIKLFSAHWQEW